MSAEPKKTRIAALKHRMDEIAAGMEKSQRGEQINLATLRPKLASCEKALADAEAEIAHLRSLAATGEKVANVLAAVLDVSPHEFFQTMLAADAKAALAAWKEAK